MKKEIEEIIKRNLPEKKEFISKFTIWNDRYRYATLQGKEEYPTPDMIADWWLSKINTSLIADEVLKVVVEKIEEYKPAIEALGKYQQADDFGVMVLVSRQAIAEVLQLLLSLSPNKE